MTRFPERRQARSCEPQEAARLYLEAMAARHRHRNVVLSDACGHLVAGAGTNPEGLDNLAAAAPIAFARPEIKSALTPLTAAEPMHVWRMNLADVECYLTALGGDDHWPTDARQALSRIFDRAAA